MKRMICWLAALTMFVSGTVMLGGCEDGDINDYLEQMGMQDLISASDANADDGDISMFVSSGSDVLYDEMIGTWLPDEIYQYAVVSDLSEEEAMKIEQDTCISLGYSNFSHYGDDLERVVYKIKDKATYDDLTAQGVQVESLIDKYGDNPEIIAVEVYDEHGAYCTTLFLINKETMLAYGAGMNIYTYSRMESVG